MNGIEVFEVGYLICLLWIKMGSIDIEERILYIIFERLEDFENVYLIRNLSHRLDGKLCRNWARTSCIEQTYDHYAQWERHSEVTMRSCVDNLSLLRFFLLMRQGVHHVVDASACILPSFDDMQWKRTTKKKKPDPTVISTGYLFIFVEQQKPHRGVTLHGEKFLFFVIVGICWQWRVISVDERRKQL